MEYKLSAKEIAAIEQVLNKDKTGSTCVEVRVKKEGVVIFQVTSKKIS